MSKKDNNSNINALEFTPVKSRGDAAIYFRIPASIILDCEAGNSRASAFSFFSIRRDMENSITFTLNGMAKWLKRKPDRHAGGTNDKLSECVSYLSRKNFISLSGKLGNASEVDAMLNIDKISDECDHSIFATVYLDELKKILSYDVKSADVTLLVFAWLRMRIIRRRNNLFPEEQTHESHDEDVKERKARSPEAYDCYCYEIANEIGISDRMVSKAIGILSDLELIYYEQLPKTSSNGKWKTNRTIFCNKYRRDNGSLLASGKDYYMQEVANKKKKIERYMKNQSKC